MADLQWYVVRAVSGQEKKVQGYLEGEINRKKLSEYITQVLIPTEKIVEMRNGKKYNREKIFFPGYVLVQADLNQLEVGAAIMNIPGVLGFLGMEGKSTVGGIKPTPLRPAEVKRLLGQVDEEAEKGVTIQGSYMVGELVKIIDGPFIDMIGTIESVFDERKKLNVIIKVFGRDTPTEVNYTEVEKIE
jgi:transcriptional antiterminator NusG